MLADYRPAIMRCMPERKDWLPDILSGILVGVIALPLAIAFAIASGMPPAAGIATAVVAGLLIALLGGSRFQIGGPTGAFVGLCALTVAQHGAGGLALATVMGGVLLVALGLFRLGSVVRLIPAPVVIGFTSGIAVIIASTQLRDALGLTQWPAENPTHFHQRLQLVYVAAASFRPGAVAVCLATMAIMLGFRHYLPRWPGALVALVVVSLVVLVGGIEVERIGDRFGALPSGIPLPSLASFAPLEIHSLRDLLQRMADLSGTAFAIGMLAAIESLLSATVADSMGKDQHHSDSELIGQGIANLVVPFFGGIPATGAIARTATNIRAGARSPLSGVIHAITLLLIMVVATPLVVHIPMAALAGILLVVAWYMSEIHHWPHILRGGRGDAFLLPLSFLLTVFIDLSVAVQVGVLLGMFFFVRRLSQAASVRIWGQGESGALILGSDPIPSHIEVFEVDGPFFFGMAVHLRNLLEGLDSEHRVLILRMRHVPFVDATAAAALRDLIGDCRRQHRQLILSGVGDDSHRDLQRHGIIQSLGRENVLKDIRAALARAKDLGPPEQVLQGGT